jgi:hypothetical protein
MRVLGGCGGRVVAVLERGEGEGHVDGAAEGRAQSAGGAKSGFDGGEHVFVKLRSGSDGTGRVQGVLHGSGG